MGISNGFKSFDKTVAVYYGPVYERSPADLDIALVHQDADIALVHQDAFVNLLNSEVDRAFNETVFGQHEYSSGYMPRSFEGVITQSLHFLDQSCLWFVPPYVIQKFDSHLFWY